MLKRLLLLLTLLLASCGALHYDEQTKVWVCFICGGIDHGLKGKKDETPKPEPKGK